MMKVVQAEYPDLSVENHSSFFERLLSRAYNTLRLDKLKNALIVANEEEYEPIINYSEQDITNGVMFRLRFICCVKVNKPKDSDDVMMMVRNIRADCALRNVHKRKVFVVINSNSVKVCLRPKQDEVERSSLIIEENTVTKIRYVLQGPMNGYIVAYIYSLDNENYRCSLFKAFSSHHAKSVTNCMEKSFEMAKSRKLSGEEDENICDNVLKSISLDKAHHERCNKLRITFKPILVENQYLQTSLAHYKNLWDGENSYHSGLTILKCKLMDWLQHLQNNSTNANRKESSIPMNGISSSSYTEASSEFNQGNTGNSLMNTNQNNLDYSNLYENPMILPSAPQLMPELSTQSISNQIFTIPSNQYYHNEDLGQNFNMDSFFKN